VTVLVATVDLAVLGGRRERADERAALHLTLFTLALILLWSRGFSPQFGAWVLPLLLLAFPGWSGTLLAVAYSPLLLADYALPVVRADLYLPLYLSVAVVRAAFTLLIAALAARRWLGWGRIPSRPSP
jgi:hypothetical protein